MADTSSLSNWMMVVLTAVIAIGTAALFIWQARQFSHDKKVHNANYKLALFDHRMKIYSAIEDCLQDFIREGGPPVNSIVKLRWEIRNASFLLPEVSLALANEIVKKGFEHNLANVMWEPLRARAYAGEPLSEEEDAARVMHLEKKHELEKWFLDQIQEERLFHDFEPYLKLPEAL